MRTERPAQAPGYQGRPLLKPPVWTWEIPLYFFVGGLAGMAAVIAGAAWWTRAGRELVRAALWLAVAGAALSPLLLVLDLGRPARFLHMLRVLKWRSPMSVGVWVLLSFSATVTTAAGVHEWVLRAAPVGAIGLVADALFAGSLAAAAGFGAVLATYTGVLIGVTAVPAWAVHHRTLPLHFGVAGLGSAAGALELLGFHAPALGAIGLAAAAVETAFGAWIELRRHGAADRALRRGRAGATLRAAGALAGPGALALRLAGLAPVAAAAFVAGALASRYGWLWAGRASARDPEAALALSRAA